MPVMSRVRRVVARRPWIQWVAIGTLGVVAAASVADAVARVEAERAAWGRPVTVWVATGSIELGEPIAAEPTEVPDAVRPPGATADDPAGEIARQAIGPGEIVTTLDVADTTLVPTGWLIAPVRESPPSGAAVGERVQVVSDGFVVADTGVVTGTVDDVTLVAVPAAVAPLLPAASDTTRVALLRSP